MKYWVMNRITNVYGWLKCCVTSSRRIATSHGDLTCALEYRFW